MSDAFQCSFTAERPRRWPKHQVNLLLLAGLIFAAPIIAQDGGDQVVFARFGGLVRVPLPGGSAGSVSPQGSGLVAIEVTDDGTVLALRARTTSTGHLLHDYLTIGPDGVETVVATPPIGPSVGVLDLALGIDDDFWVLTLASHPIQGLFVNQFFRIDRQSGLLQDAFELQTDRLRALTAGPGGRLWVLSDEELLKLDPDTRQLSPTGVLVDASGFGTRAVDTDTTGALWLLQEALIVSPPFFRLARLDPVTGTLRPASFDLDIHPDAMAIQPGCEPTATARCLLGGRFRATVAWRDFEDRTGEGQVAPRGSADSALFWFFEPANFEILVKMVDGCAENGHYWVFAAGTTDVEHTLEVTDLQTGEVFSSTNPLGQASAAITATDAFASCP